MKVDLFDFDLPAELIAQHPVEPRDAARMLDLTGGGQAGRMTDRIVSDLPGLLRPDDVMVVNDTKVIPARLIGRRGQAKVEVTLHRRIDGSRWRAFAKPAKKLKIGDDFVCELGLVGEVVEKLDGGEVELLFPYTGEALLEQIRMQGVMPLPPYIKRQDGAEDMQDRSDYQPIFARNEGAVAAPTASLHFTDRLLAALDAKGVTRETLTLHVGAGTFLPVKVNDTDDHVMHEEIGILSPETAARLNAAKAEGRRIVAIGTTALRLLESAADENGVIHPFDGTTDLFITPGYRFKAVDLLLTNFHLPKSTLFMLVSAFAGLERMKDAYEHAKAEGYRFYSYGDCCLLERTS